jgi:hypothetical protein
VFALLPLVFRERPVIRGDNGSRLFWDLARVVSAVSGDDKPPVKSGQGQKTAEKSQFINPEPSQVPRPQRSSSPRRWVSSFAARPSV